MAAPLGMNGRAARQPFPKKELDAPSRPMSGDLMVLAALVGFSRALFGRTANGSGRVAERGRDADKPAEIPDIILRLYHGFQNDRILLIAAGVTFYGLLALFPATAAIVSLYGLFADATSINGHISLISGFLPDGAIAVIGDQVKRIAGHAQSTLGFTFLGTLALSLWGANAGTKAIFDALNIIYKEREKRSFLQLTLRSLLFTLAGIVLALLAMASVVVVPLALKILGIPGESGLALFTLLRWPVLYLALLLALACLYRYGPSRTRPQWRWVTWGSALSGAIWVAGSLALSWYVSNFGTYNATYGSLGAVIGFMVWMWLSIIIVLMGGEINAEMEHQTARDTTDGNVARSKHRLVSP